MTGTEAKDVADRLDAGETLTAALRAVGAGRRHEARALLSSAGLGHAQTSGVLRAIEGARSTVTSADLVWTMPGHLTQSGALTGSTRHLVDGARQSVTCSTYNFQRSSMLWKALRHAAARPEIAVRVYVESLADDLSSRSPTSTEVAGQLHPATVLRTRMFDGTRVRNHAKFLVVDHRFVLVTSANFSWSAEQANVELGILLDDVGVAESIEREMRKAEDSLYERVRAAPRAPA